MLIMITLEEIKSKYSLDGAVSVEVDLESMRDDAKSTLNNADEFVKNSTREADRGIPIYDKEFMNRRKSRITNDIREQKRKVALAQKYIDEINGILDKANENIAKVK